MNKSISTWLREHKWTNIQPWPLVMCNDTWLRLTISVHFTALPINFTVRHTSCKIIFVYFKSFRILRIWRSVRCTKQQREWVFVISDFLLWTRNYHLTSSFIFSQIEIEASHRHWINLTNDDSSFLAQRVKIKRAISFFSPTFSPVIKPHLFRIKISEPSFCLTSDIWDWFFVQ